MLGALAAVAVLAVLGFLEGSHRLAALIILRAVILSAFFWAAAELFDPRLESSR